MSLLARSRRSGLALLSSAVVLGTAPRAVAAQDTAPQLRSPDGRNVIAVEQRDGRILWSVSRDGRAVLVPSRLGFTFRNGPAIDSGLAIVGEERREHDERFTLPWGEQREVRDVHRELRVRVAERRAPSATRCRSRPPSAPSR
jgi:alpha-glucosidase